MAFKRAATAVKLQNRAATALKEVPHGIDSSTFFSPRIPPEVRVAVPLMGQLEQAQIRALMQVAVEVLNGRTVSQQDFADLQLSLGCEGTNCDALLTALYTILRMAVRNRTKLSVIENDLAEMNVPGSLVKDIAHVVRAKRFDFESAALQTRPRMPRLTNLQWRVDIMISNSSLLRVMKPSVLMQMTFSDRRIKTFEVPIEQFHELRLNVAKVLRDMQALERHPVMRLAFDREKALADQQQK